jgi:hypothetical protein
VRFGDHGLINGQSVTFRGEKVLTFPSMRGIIRMARRTLGGVDPAFDGRKS